MRILTTLIFINYIAIGIKRFRNHVLRRVILSILQRFLGSILIFLCKYFIWISPSLDQWRLTWNYLLISIISRIFWISSFLTANKCLKMNTFFPVCILYSFLIWNKIEYSFLFHFFRIYSFPPAIVWNGSEFEVPSTKTAILKFLTKHKYITRALYLLVLILNCLNLI
jgi:hypothetical protein